MHPPTKVQWPATASLDHEQSARTPSCFDPQRLLSSRFRLLIYPNFWWRWVKILYRSSTKSKHNDWNPGDSWFRRMVFMVLMLSESRFRGKCVELCSKRHNVSSWKYPIVHWTNGKKGESLVLRTTPLQLQPPHGNANGGCNLACFCTSSQSLGCQPPSKDKQKTSIRLLLCSRRLWTCGPPKKLFGAAYTKVLKTPRVWSWFLVLQKSFQTASFLVFAEILGRFWT